MFTEIDVVGHLQVAAKKGSKLTAYHCCKALTTINASLPLYQSWDVLKWGSDQVCTKVLRWPVEEEKEAGKAVRGKEEEGEGEMERGREREGKGGRGREGEVRGKEKYTAMHSALAYAGSGLGS